MAKPMKRFDPTSDSSSRLITSGASMKNRTIKTRLGKFHEKIRVVGARSAPTTLIFS
jgi:hypothetical protein